MKAASISRVSLKSNSICFEGKKKQQEPPSNQKTHNSSKIKTALPTAALVLAMLSDPVNIDKAEAANLPNDITEMEMQRHRHPHHRPAPGPGHHHHPMPVVPHHRPMMPPHHNHRHYEPAYEYLLPTMIMMEFIRSISELNNFYTNPVSVGGVTFNRNDVYNVGYYYDNDVMYNSVTMTNGTIVNYPSQASGNYAMVHRGEGGYVIEGLANAYIEGSNYNDRLTLKGCRYSTIDVGSDDRIDKVNVTTYRVLPGGVRQYTDNVEVIAGGGDVVNGQRVYDNQSLFYSGF